VRIWINFKELRARLKMEDVLRFYNVEVKRKGDQHQGICPLPNHSGKRTSESFSANLEQGIFHCFGCSAKGNTLEFAAFMEGIDETDGAALRKVAIKLQKEFFPEGANTRKKPEVAQRELACVSKDLPVVVNAPLDFELKSLEHGHPYLLGRGFELKTIVHFGIGFCSRGVLKNRVAIPLHDHVGKLIGYAGRVIDDSVVSDDNPRYVLPSKRTREGMLFEFRKTLFLYNGFRLKAPCDDLIVVEGFPSVWWLTQNGHANVVATMGTDRSEKQAELIVSLVKPSGRIWVMPDGDKGGERFGQSVVLQVSPYRFVRWVRLADGLQPTDLPGTKLKECFTV
jgi:DNA primase